MKKVLLSLTVLFSALMVMAQGFGKASIAIVPNADIVAYSNADAIFQKEFTKKAQALFKSMEQEEWFKKKAAEDDDDVNVEKLKVAAEKLYAALGFNKDENCIKTAVFSLAFNNFSPKGVEPDYGKIDMAFAAELTKPMAISPANLPAAIGEFFNALGDDAKDSYSIGVGVYGTTPTVTIELKDDDIPNAFRKLTLAVINPSLVLFATEASAKAALDRAKAAATPALDAFFSSIKEESFVAVKMMPELAAQIGQLGGGEDTPAWGMLSKAKGLALVVTTNDKMNISFNVYLNDDKEAAAVKAQIWDAQLMMMVNMFTPSINESFGGSLPLLQTIKGAANGNVFGISVVLSEEDIKAVIAQQKKEFEAAKDDDGDDD
ncbi:MAG: hypothetical protein J6X55_08835 [Victivallales bacterium]|nr:hypothetical protein [Victivallales bacterium]